MDFLGGEDTGEDRAHGAADAVNPESVERIVVAKHALEIGHREEWHHTGKDTHDHRGS